MKRLVLLLEHQLWVQSGKTKGHFLIRATVQDALQKKIGRDPKAIGQRHDEKDARCTIAFFDLVQGRGIHA
ncbi:hypothetical protein AA102526_0135 [Asaia lannensis NBRC 102526]|nr:hypothetical protein AA102526_0135 [Asaia lannensis NBRC 102526]